MDLRRGGVGGGMVRDGEGEELRPGVFRVNETVYKEGMGNIRCEECGQEGYDTLEERHFTSSGCSGVVRSVAAYRVRHPDAPTRTTHMRESTMP